MTYLFGAYGIIWLALFGYVFLIDRKTARLGEELEALRKSAKAD